MYRIARNFCGPKILQIAVKRPSADTISVIKLSTVEIPVIAYCDTTDHVCVAVRRETA